MRGQCSLPDLILSPQNHAIAEPIGLHQRRHEGDLIEAYAQEKLREISQACRAEIAAAIEIAVSKLVASFQMLLVFRLAASEPAGNRPDATRLEGVSQHGMRHQSRNPAITVRERSGFVIHRRSSGRREQNRRWISRIAACVVALPATPSASIQA
jgi:hypothetical protein